MIRAATTALSIIGGLSGAPVWAQTPVGTAEKIVKAGYQTPHGGERNSVSRDDGIFGQAKLETEAASWLVSRFLDETSLTVAPNAQVTIDEYVYRNNGSGRLGLALVRGALRFTSGRMPKSAYSIFTPIAYIGVRGTDFSAQTIGDSQIDVWVDVGEVEISPRDNPLPVILAAPAYARCDADGCKVGPPPALPPTANIPGGPAVAYSGSLDGPDTGFGDDTRGKN